MLLLCLQRGERDRRCGVPSCRLKNDGWRLIAFVPQLLGDHKPVLCVTDDRRRAAVEAAQAPLRLLQHGALPPERQKLLGSRGSGDRPQSATDTTG